MAAEAGRPLVAVLIPNWNGREDLLECLSSLESLEYPKDRLEIVICDNGSTDGSVDAVRSRFREMASDGWRKLEIVCLPRNIGIAAAYNAALERADPSCFALLRSETDVIFSPDLLRVMVWAMEKADNAGIVGCRVHSYANHSTVWYGACFTNWWSGRMRIVFPREPVVCDDVAGCCMLIRAELAQRLSFFFRPDRFLADERDFCFRARAIGYQTIYQPRAVAYHKGMRTAGKIPDFVAYHATRDSIMFMNQFNRFPQKLAWWVVQLLWGLKLLWRGERAKLAGLRDAALMAITGRTVDSGDAFR